MTTQITTRADLHMNIAARRLARAEASGNGQEILSALYALLNVASRFGFTCSHVVLSDGSMRALHVELAARARYGLQPALGRREPAPSAYHGEVIALAHNGRAVEVVNGDAAEA